MIYAIRPATDAERARAAASWRTMLTLPKGAEMLSLGRYEVARGWLARAEANAVDEHMFGEGWPHVLGGDRCFALAADHPDASGLALGWLAFDLEPFTVHAVHVEAGSRKAWVGRSLLRHVLDLYGSEPRCSMRTHAGRRLLERVQADMKARAA